MSLIINSLALKDETINTLEASINRIVELFNCVPKLVIVNASDDFSSRLYIKNKIKIGEELGVDVEVIQYSETVTTDELEAKLIELNEDDNVTAVILQLPIYDHLDKERLIQVIDPKKDCDGFSDLWLGRMIQNKEAILPCTPQGVMNILKHHKVDLVGKEVCVVGKSSHVGMPLSILLSQAGATVTIAHSRSDLETVIRRSDIVISCVGRYDLIKAEWVKQGATIIGVGYSRTPEGKLGTDYIVDEVASLGRARFIGSVTNNTGLATVLSLFENVVKLCEFQKLNK